MTTRNFQPTLYDVDHFGEYPDTAFFNNFGGSYNRDIGGYFATDGFLMSGTDAVYALGPTDPNVIDPFNYTEIVALRAGSITLQLLGQEGQPEATYIAGDGFVIPERQTVRLTVVGDQPALYTCFYPGCYLELEGFARIMNAMTGCFYDLEQGFEQSK